MPKSESSASTKGSPNGAASVELRPNDKDSTVLAHVLKTLNERHGYGLELFLLSVDEGIKGYRDDSLETVKSNEKT